MIDMQITGAKEIAILFETLARKEVGGICRKGTRDAQKSFVLKDTKSNAMSMVGGKMAADLAKNLVVRAMTKMKRNHYGAKTTIKPTDAFVHITKEGHRYYIPFAIEYGHAFPGRGGGKNAPKDVKPIPFMRKAYEQNRKKAAAHLTMRIRILLDSFIRSKRKTA